MKSKYTSGKSVGKNQTVPISVDDPRLKPGKRGQTYARQGAEIQEIGLDGKTLISGGRTINNPAGVVNPTPRLPDPVDVVIPPSGNQPPITYPGGSGPVIITPTDPTSVSAVWSGNDLVISFNWDYSNSLNATISQFIVALTSDGITKKTPTNTFIPNKTQTAQSITVTKSMITSMFNVFVTNFSSVCVLTADPLNNISNTICALTVPTYVLSLPVPIITVSPIASGYSVAYTTPTEDVYDAIDIAEYESSSATEPTGVTYLRTYLGTINPANIISSGTNKRWVKARFSSDGGIYTAYSAAQAVTPTSPVVADNDGPPNVGTVTTSGGIDTSGYLGFNAYATISWSAVTTGDIRGYRIRFSNDGGTTYSYVDSPGDGLTYKLGGLAVGSTYKIAVATYDQYNNTSTNYVSGTDVTVTGIPSVSNYITAGPFEFGIGVGSVATNKGLYFDSSNYWYVNATNSARLKVGGSTSNYLSWDGSDFLIDGNISARKGTFSGNVTVAPGGSLQSFITPPTVFSISSVTYTASTATYTTTANHGYIVGDDILISGLLPEGYNGKFTITARTLTTFTVTNSTNAIVTDPLGSVILITGAGFVLNKDGLAFNSSITRDITTINSETGLFTTKSANIGGWSVDSSAITKSSLTGGGNITLNSTSGYISVSNANIASYTAGINATTTALTSNAFWAGTGGPLSTSNGFRVTLGGQLYATGAAITGGTITSTGALGTVTMDGVNDLISITTGAASTYLFGRNSNTYLTSGFPFGGTVGSPTYASLTNLTANPYFSAGSGFKDYWGTDNTKGIGIFTGAWDYFAGGASTPFITATTTGLQLSAGPTLGLLLDAGTAASNGKLDPAVPNGTPSMLFYTAKNPGAPYSPTTAYGAWASFTNNKIKLTAASTVFINVDGTTGSQNIEIASTANIWQKFTSTAIRTQVSSNVYQQFDSSGIKIASSANNHITLTSASIILKASNGIVYASGVANAGTAPTSTQEAIAYDAPSQIKMDPTYGVVISGIQVHRDVDMTDAGDGNNYRGIAPLGRYPRSRMLVVDPGSGEARLGMGIYYRGSGITSAPTSSTGYAGDLLIDF